MKLSKLNLDKSKKYVVACSFGPDSMALLNLCIQNNLNIVVAHVNYHKRNVSDFEQQSLTKFCDKKSIQIEVLDTTNLKVKGNFQEWAREIRYKFFKKVSEKYNCEAVLIAHQEDDFIETYLMQKNRGNAVKYWGIAEENDIFGIHVIRPLLDYSKQELLDYNIENKIPYSIDESNLTDNYTRNKVRHHIVEKLSKSERRSIVSDIKKSKIESPTFCSEMPTEEFLNMSYEKIVQLIDHFMNLVNEHRDLSVAFISEIKKAFNSKTNCSIQVTKSLLLESNYGFVTLVNSKKLQDYAFKFSETIDNDLIKIDFSNGAEDRNIFVTKNLIVRNLKTNDEVKVNNYTCKARRLFIDWKMPKYIRKIWPCICNENNEIIYVPRYKKEFIENHKSTFVIKLDNLRVFEK